MIKKLSPILILFILFLYKCTFSPYNKSENGSVKLFKSDLQIENKGKHITSVGKLRVLLVYAMFKDDEIKSNSWNYNLTELPDWGKSMINETTEINFPTNNLTQYFYEMSQGNFWLYGDVYPNLIVPKHSQLHYKSIAEVNSEILREIDNNVDFTKYDNWSRDDNRKFINEPDGKADMIFILYRNFENHLFFNNGWTGVAHLYLNDNFQTNDKVTVSSGRLDKGSGIQSRGGHNGFNYIKYVLAHEFGHFLLGAFHIENITNLALMTGGPVWNASRGMHSWEKEKLGWLSYKDINVGENSQIILDDYFSKNEAARIKLSKEEWYVLENHQQISSNDWAKSKGVYIYHIQNAVPFVPKITVKCADGNWNFKVDNENQKLIKTTPNPLGKSELNFNKRIKQKSYAAYEQVYSDNSAWGDEFDSYNLSYNNIISPVSNPSTNNIEEIGFAIHITDIKGSLSYIDIFFNDIYKNTPPSKPQLTEIINKNETLTLHWLKNEEQDLVGYNFYFKNGNNYPRSLYLPSTKLSVELSQYFKSNLNSTIWITAVDRDNKESVESDYFIISENLNRTWNWVRKEKL